MWSMKIHRHKMSLKIGSKWFIKNISLTQHNFLQNVNSTTTVFSSNDLQKKLIPQKKFFAVYNFAFENFSLKSFILHNYFNLWNIKEKTLLTQKVADWESTKFCLIFLVNQNIYFKLVNFVFLVTPWHIKR